MINFEDVLILDIETTGFDPHFDVIVALGFYSYKLKQTIIIDLENYENEKKLLEEFIKYIRYPIAIIGYNIKNFDIPFLKVRFFYNNIRSVDFNPKNVFVYDLMEYVTLRPYTYWSSKFSTNYIRLDDILRQLNIKARYDINGKMVLKLFIEKRFTDIRLHLEDDINKEKILFELLKDHYPDLEDLYNYAKNLSLLGNNDRDKNKY